MKTIKELANIGSKASALLNKGCGTLAVTRNHPGWFHDEEQRQAFAAAVKEAVLADMLPKSDSGTSVKTVPLDINDIRATDEFKPIHEKTIYVPLFWDSQNVKTVRNWNTYEELATNYLRRQHGSTEWKPCTKEEVK